MLWQVHPQNIDRGNELAGLLNISSITAGVLMNRGLLDPQKAREFLYPTLTHLHDPFLMSGMEAAVTRVIRAIKDKEKILIYGDYDADGATSTALLVKFFKTLGVDVHYYIPHRINEGYGMHRSAIDPIKRLATDLIITVDNGISAEKEVE